MDGVGVVVVCAVGREVVHDGTPHILAVLDDSLDIAHGLHSGGIFVGVGRRDATKDAMVVHREIAEGFGIVVLDAGGDECFNLCHDRVDLGCLERCVGLRA